ncbi:MAG: insulinase family protein [Paraprevotella sp.]|nr:insulinase family protein [Paraprevotella sp.]
MKQKILFFFFLCCAIVGQAQPIDWNKKLPTDTNVYVGKLPNGITYYLRHNEEPKDRASFFIIRNAGALLENDDQDGLAHYLEHMAFNGSKNFPGNSLIFTLERHGISFCGNLNAYTTQNETVYNISDVPMTDESLIDTCLLILHDWSYYLTLDPKDIDEERGVITEEWRTRNNSASRISNQTRPVLYKGSQYAVRDVIGDMDVIHTFKPETLKEFYHKWYRTDLEAISIVGDFDIKAMDKKIKDVFSSIPAIKDPAPRPFFEIPSHEDTYFCLATDKEATSSNVKVVRMFRDKTYDGKGYATYQDIKNSLMIGFYNSMISDRISEVVRRGQAPYVSASIEFSNMVKGYYAYTISASAKPNQEKEALEGVMEEHERVYLHGFTEAELDRAKTNLMTTLESMLKDKDKTTNDSYADELQSNFLDNEAVIDIVDYVNAVKEILPTITVQEVSDQVKRWWKPDNRTILITGPSEGVTHLTEQDARDIVTEEENKTVNAYEDNSVNGKLIEQEPTPGKITKIKKLPALGSEEWTLSNGAKVIYRKADYEKDDVSLSAYSPGGSSLYDDPDMLPAASNAGIFASNYGLGQYDNIALGKLLTGKKAECNISIGGLYENVNGESTPKDFETMMQMLYLRFTAPRFDTLVHKVIIEHNHIYAKQIAGQPQTIIRDSLSTISANYSPRVQLFNDAYVDKLTLDRIEKVYRDRICDASDFTFFIVGNVDEDTAKVMTEKYIGAIPSIYRHEKWVDRNVRAPKGKVEKNIAIPMEVPKSTVVVMFNKGMKYDLRDSYLINVLGNILTNRYTNTIREEQGGTYGVGVSGTAAREPYNNYQMYMTFECDPGKAAELKPLLYKELDDILKNGVTEEELDKVVKNALKETEQSKLHNAYWMSTLVTYYRTGVNQNDPKNMEDLLKSIRPKDIQKFTEKFMKGADVLDLVFSPEKK